MLEKKLHFWFKASVASSFSKSSIGRGIYFALSHMDLHETFILLLLFLLSFSIFSSSTPSLASLPYVFSLDCMNFISFHRSTFIHFSYFSLLSSPREHNVSSPICYHSPSAIFVTSLYPSSTLV